MDAAIDQSALNCFRCNYNLRGLSPDGRCPECGTSIADTLVPSLLDAATNAWRIRFGIGLWMLIAAMILGPIAATADASFEWRRFFPALGFGASRASIAWVTLSSTNLPESEIAISAMTGVISIVLGLIFLSVLKKFSRPAMRVTTAPVSPTIPS